jgi:drug/metabolite transporter (DMT)-like permease
MFSIIFGFIGFSMFNIAQAIQKLGLLIRKEDARKGARVWLAGIFGSFLASGVNYLAVILGSASLAAAMAGTGLASLAIFSRLVLKEPVGKLEVCGIAVILLSAVTMGIFSDTPSTAAIHIDILLYLFTGVALAGMFLWIFMRRKAGVGGIVIAGFSGALGGFVPLFQKASASDAGRQLALFSGGSAGQGPAGDIIALFTNPFAVAWIVLSLVSTLVMQFSYKKTPAIRSIPMFTGFFIIVPVVGGVLCLGESLSAGQWCGVAGIIAGLILLGWKRPQASS